MTSRRKLRFDEIGYWSEIKLDILKEYARAYSTIFSSKHQARFHHLYVDAFAGAGVHLSKATREFVPGSPLNALRVEPPFKEYYFIDLDGRKVEFLKRTVGDRSDVHIYHGDCNDLLLREVFPNVRYEDYRRGLCVLDPYGLHLNWEVIRTAGQLRTIDLFLTFPVMDINRNALWRHPEKLGEVSLQRMNAFWGDDSWRQVAYKPDPTLFGDVDVRTEPAAVPEAFQNRLRQVAGFPHVPKPLPMRNSAGAIVYYLFFASQNPAGLGVAEYLLRKYQHHGARP
jgi:three-Cys-motif partner protein